MPPATPSPHKLTVVQVLPALESGGVERGTLEVGKYLVEHGHRSIVVSAGGRMVEQLLREGSEHVTWDIGRKSLWTLRLIPRLRRFLRENKVNVLHARSRMPAWFCYLAWKGMDPRTRPHFVTTVHGMYSVNAYSAVMTKGEAVIAVSETIRDYIRQNYPTPPPDSIAVIPRGIDRTAYPYGYSPPQEWLIPWREAFPELAGKRVLLLPGRITRLKGHEDFLKLVATLVSAGHQVHGLIVGGADPRKRAYLSELETLARTLGIGHAITFTGQRSDLREIMAVSDIVLSLSTQPESFGRTVLEAMSLGVPVIGYDHGGVGEQLRLMLPEGRIHVRDEAALASKVADWLKSPPDIPREHPYTLQGMLDATLATYLKLAA
jgi:glycosyltransferase involved in cell wall biosynthesis